MASLVALARRNVQAATQAQLSRGWSAVSSRLAYRSTGRWRFLLAGAAALAMALGMVLVLRVRMRPMPKQALAYDIEGGSITDGGYLQEKGGLGVRLVFEEGTEFALMRGARGRLRAVDSMGARISIEQGTARFQVTPRTNAKWVVDVGPFLVTVRGTAFTVSWDPASERFELRLQHGQVSVKGPVANDEIPLRAGQKLAIDLPKQETLITEQRPEEPWIGSSSTPPPTTGTPTSSVVENRPAPAPATSGDTPVRSSPHLGNKARTDARATTSDQPPQEGATYLSLPKRSATHGRLK
jgi:hypothetical protein